MSAIRLSSFKGIMPRVSPKLLEETAATVASNCRLGSGAIQPLLQSAADAKAVKYMWSEGAVVGIVNVSGTLYYSGTLGTELMSVSASTPTTEAPVERGRFTSRINGIAADSSGNLYLALEEGKVVQVAASPSYAVTTVGEGLLLPSGVVLDSDGVVYVADIRAGRIAKFVYGEAWVASTFASLLDKPTGLAVDASKNIYVSEAETGNIIQITQAGVRTVLSDGLKADAEAEAGSESLDHPEGIAFFSFESGTVDTLFVADVGNERLVAIDVTTKVVTELVDGRASGIALGSLGTTAHITNTDAGKVQATTFVADPTSYTYAEVRVIPARTLANVETVYLWRYGDGASDLKWLAWDGDVQVAPSNLADDPLRRLIVTGDTRLSYVDGDNTYNDAPGMVYRDNAGETVYRTLWMQTPPVPYVTIDGSSDTDTGWTVDIATTVSYTGTKANGSTEDDDITATRTAIPVVWGRRDNTFGFFQDAASYSKTVYNWESKFVHIDITGVSETITLKKATVTQATFVRSATFTNPVRAAYSATQSINLNTVCAAATQLTIKQNSQDYVVASRSATAAARITFTDPTKNSYPILTIASPVAVTFDAVTIPSNETRFGVFVQTLVDALGYESAPSPASVEVNYTPATVLKYTGFTVSGEYVKRRIYKNAVGTVSDVYQFVLEDAATAFDGAETTFADKSAILYDDNLGETLEVTQSPPYDLVGIVPTAYGFFAATRKSNRRELWMSKPNIPYSWDTAYTLTLHYNIVGLASAHGDLYALTDAYPAVLQGVSPDQMGRIYLSTPQPCVSAKSILAYNGAVLYVGRNGLCSIAPGSSGVDIISESFYDSAQWDAMKPETALIGAHHNGVFVSMNDGTTRYNLVFWRDAGTVNLTTHDENADLFFFDVVEGDLYMVTTTVAAGTTIRKWEGGSTYKTARWVSKPFYGEKRMFNSVRINCEKSTCTLVLYATDGIEEASTPDEYQLEQRVSVTVDRNTSRRLGRERPERVWQVELQSDGVIEFASVASSMSEVAP